MATTVRDEETVLGDLLGRVTQQMGDLDEYVVVDDGSSDATADILRSWAAGDSRLKVVSRPPTGIAASRNAAVTAARHPYVVMIDAGCTPRPGWLDALRGALGSSTTPGLVVGVYAVTTRNAWERAMALSCFPDLRDAREPTPLSRLYERLLGRSFSAERLDTRSSAFRTEAWAAVGGFDETLPTAEDAAFGAAVGTAGYHRVLSLDAEVQWSPRPNVASTARMYYRYGYGGARSGHATLVTRDLLRAIALPAGVMLFMGGRPRRALAVAGAALYLSNPVRRALRDRAGSLTLLAIPASLGLKDVAKAAGCLAGLLTSRRGP